MADYTPGDLTAAETSGFNNDKPMFVVQQADSPADAHFTTTGIHTGTDQTDTDFPAARAHDDFGSIVTKTASGVASTTTKYYNFNFTASGITFDTLLITGHNFNSAGFQTISLEISNAADFGSGAGDDTVEIASYSVSGTTDNRILITNLNNEGGSSDAYSSSGTAQRYADVEYARLKIVHASGSKTPELGEIILGRRYQLQRNPDLPYNNKNEVSSVSDFQSRSGITKRYVFYRGQALRTFVASISASAEITVIENWFNAIDEGTRPFVYIETPSSSAKAQIMLLDDAGLNFPLNGPFERRLQFSMTEQPPFLSRE